MNQFTIEFKNPKDLADKISKYNDLMNPKPISDLAVDVLDEKPAKPTVKKASKEAPVVVDPDLPVVEAPTVEPAEFDPAAYWVDFKSWLKSIGNDGIKKALDVFRSHGVQGNPCSDDLTPEIVAELDALMKGE